MKDRKHYLDNIRWITILIVIVYHVIYSFNCSGVISNIGVKGIPIMDTFLVFVYPWFMCLLFVISGISSRYSLKKRTNKEFLKERIKRILIPSILGFFAYSWITGFVTNRYVNMFGENADSIPLFIKYIVYSLTGIGPLWYAHTLFIASILLILIRLIDKEDRLFELGNQIDLLELGVLVFLVWGSSFLLNVPIISVYRFGIYLLMFFLGYYVFSHEKIMEKLKKISTPMGIISLILGIVYVYYYYGTNYTDNICLQNIFTNIYLWISILAILGLGQKYLNFENKFSIYMTKNNFNFYVLHYPIVVLIGYLVVTYLNLPFILNYIVILIVVAIILPIIVEIVKRIPILNKIVLGIYIKKENNK